jgi:hypothetical protein
LQVLGLAHITYWAPQDILHTFLHTKLQDGQNIGFICKACAVGYKRRLTVPCTHSDKERAADDCFSTPEVSYAVVSLNYRVIVHELLVWETWEKIFERFIALLALQKLAHTSYPDNVRSEEEKLAYCEEINIAMDFERLIGKKLSPEMISPCSAKKLFMKNAMNFFLGMFGKLLLTNTFSSLNLDLNFV